MNLAYFHWNIAEAELHAETLRGAGHRVVVFAEGTKLRMKDIDHAAPDLLVIDLRRLPSHGKEVATTLRQRAASRSIPQVFVEGDEAKTAAVRESFGDATFTPWARVLGALRSAHARPVPKAAATAAAPRSPSGYSGKPLPQKLGVKSGSTLLLMGAPSGFDTTLGALPDGVVVRTRAQGAAQTIVLFARSRADLAKRLGTALRSLADKGALWVSWPKKTSPLAGDLTEDGVRAEAFALGLVDVKVCAVDSDWSGLCLRRRAAR